MSKMPPIPPDQRSDKGPGGTGTVHDESGGSNREVPGNLEQQDRQGDIKQNTTHQGYQQDR